MEHKGVTSPTAQEKPSTRLVVLGDGLSLTLTA